MTDASSSRSPAKSRNRLIQFGGGAAAGAVVGAALVHWDLLEGLEGLDPFLGLALALGLALIILGAALVGLSYRPALLGEVLLEGSQQAATPGERAFYRLGGWGMLLGGLLAAIPPIAAAWLQPMPRTAAWGLLAAVTALALVQLAVNLQAWRRADELTRRATMEGACLALFLVEGLLFLWAAAEILELAPAASAWSIWTLAFAAYIALCGWVGWRRGVG